MEQITEDGTGKLKSRYGSYRLWELRNAVDRYLIERGIGHFCHVTINHKDKWFELKGSIDSQWTRAVLFSLVPASNGRRFIIDKLKFVAAPETKAVLS